MKTQRILVSWIGATDLRAVTESEVVGDGPIAQALNVLAFDRVTLLSDYPEQKSTPFIQWLQNRTKALITVIPQTISSPVHFGDIYQAARDVLAGLSTGGKQPPQLTLHLSPGTPAMAAVWILLAKTRFPAILIQSSREYGVQTAEIPFNIAAEFLPDLLAQPDRRLAELSASNAPLTSAFSDLIHRSPVMQRLIARAGRVALRSVPVLIEGESGTGKELLARAIHAAGPRSERDFIPINCGAIPSELVESELFGHKKGAFTGATNDRAGVFEAADKGSLFLDEIGDLPLAAQVKLLRVLQEGEVTRIGETKARRVNARIIAATHRDLQAEIRNGRFREDLFYRLAVAILKVPPLREREGDLGLLLDALLEQVNRESEEDPGYQHKTISPGAKNLLLQHDWPGNVRELLNTLRRVVLWSQDGVISPEDVQDALLPYHGSVGDSVLNRRLGEGFDLQAVLREVAVHYLHRALQEANGNKTRAANLVGLSSYQTLSNWMQKYGLEV